MKSGESILYSYSHCILMTLAWQIWAPISNLTLPALRHWVLHMDSLSDRVNHSFCDPWGIRGGGKVGHNIIVMHPWGEGMADRGFCGV